MTNQQTPARTVAELLGLTVGVFLVAIVAGVAFVVPLLALGYDIQTTAVLLGSTAIGQLAMFGLGYAYFRSRELSVPVSVPSLSNAAYAVGSVVAALAVVVAASALLTALDLVPGSVIGDSAAIDPTYLLGLAALSIFVVAPIEEFVFRGVIQGKLREQFGPAPAIAGASLLFGSLHLTNYSGSLASIVAGALLITAVGSVFGLVYERTGNLAVPIAGHAIYNVILMLLSYVALTAA